MEYAEQTSGAIRLYLTEGNFDINQLLVVKRQALTHKDIAINFGVLATSHFVQFTYRDEILSEVCACSDAIVPDNTKLLEYDFLPNLHNMPLSAQFLIFPYTFNFTYIDWNEGMKRLKLLRNKKGSGSVATLGHTFPKSDEHEDNPVTEIYVDCDGIIQVHTVHTYPNEDMMVFTESALQV